MPVQEAKRWNRAARLDRLRPRPLPAAPVRTEADAAQPGLRVPFFAPVEDGDLDIRNAVRVIRAARGVGPEKPCRFPDDLGCETQIYLGLAVRAEFSRLGMVAVAEACWVSAPDAIFFSTLLDLAEGRDWVLDGILHAARVALHVRGAPA